jgi:hypothetical protein
MIAEKTRVHINSRGCHFHGKTGYVDKINNDGSTQPYVVVFDQPAFGWSFSVFAKNELREINKTMKAENLPHEYFGNDDAGGEVSIGDESTCEHCGRVFTLTEDHTDTDYIWKPNTP